MTKTNLNRSGIYRITCEANNKIYVGSAANIRKRWKLHRNHLRMKIHHNRPMQSAWLKYGEEVFKFDVLEFCEADNIADTEQKWLDETRCYDRGIGFNILTTAYSSIGMKHSDDTLTKLRAIARSRSPEHYKKIGDAQRGRPNGRKGEKGTPWTEAQKLEASERRKGQIAWNKGMFHTEESKRKISETLMLVRRVIPEETREKIKKMRSEGATYRSISELTGVSISQCAKIFHNRVGGDYRLLAA